MIGESMGRGSLRALRLHGHASALVAPRRTASMRHPVTSFIFPPAATAYPIGAASLLEDRSLSAPPESSPSGGDGDPGPAQPVLHHLQGLLRQVVRGQIGGGHEGRGLRIRPRAWPPAEVVAEVIDDDVVVDDAGRVALDAVENGDDFA